MVSGKTTTGIASLVVFGSSLAAVVLAGTAAVIEAVKVEPLPFAADTGVTVDPVLAETAPQVSFAYRWFINGEEIVDETAGQLPGSRLTRGDQLAVEVIPVAPGGERLPSFVSLPLEVGNSSPEITSEPPAALGKPGFSYRVTAIDQDGDPLTFRLEQAPQGMTINPSSGQIDWFFKTMPEGVFPVVIVVEDGFGGLTKQSFQLNLSLTAQGSIP